MFKEKQGSGRSVSMCVTVHLLNRDSVSAACKHETVPPCHTDTYHLLLTTCPPRHNMTEARWPYIPTAEGSEPKQPIKVDGLSGEVAEPR